MPDINIQFHALPGELLTLVRQCVDQLDVHFIGVFFPPYLARELEVVEIDDLVLKGPCNSFLFADEALVGYVSSAKSLGEKLPGCLYLDVGRLSEDGLHQSRLACRTGLEAINPKWNKIASQLKNMTSVKAVALAPEGDAFSPLRSHRYTSGAKQAADNGIKILPIAGNSTLRLGVLEP